MNIFKVRMFVFLYEYGIMDKISKLNGMVNKNEIKKKWSDGCHFQLFD